MTERAARACQCGQALLIVLGAIVVLSMLAASMASKVEVVGKSTAELQQQAQASVAEGNGLAVVTHWLATRSAGPGGWGEGPARTLRADGREYRLLDGTLVSVQDHRGMLSINIVDRALMSRLLLGMGVASSRIDTMLDVLEDYVDTDSLRRLNGAEAPDYRELGLEGPRNDWAASTRELHRMPIWREEVRRNPKILELLSSRRGTGLNPNTAPLDLLASLYPGAPREALVVFDNLRKERPFEDEESAQRLTGLPFGADDTTFWVGNAVSIRVRQPGTARGREYNVLLTPASPLRPWIILESRVYFGWPATAPSAQPPEFPGNSILNGSHAATLQASR